MNTTITREFTTELTAEEIGDAFGALDAYGQAYALSCAIKVMCEQGSSLRITQRAMALGEELATTSGAFQPLFQPLQFLRDVVYWVDVKSGRDQKT